MKSMSLTAFLAASLVTFAPQDIPAGVRYKRATEDENKQASQIVTKLMKSDPVTGDFTGLFANAVVCGPNLWKSIKTIEVLLKKPKIAQFKVPNKNGVAELEGR